MVNPDEIVKEEQTGEKLGKLYNQYWEDASSNSMEMIRFFAHQKLLGGYLVRRHGDNYYPFYLTASGSVFVLKVKDSKENTAMEKIDEWKKKGLPLPEWVKTKYKEVDKELWQTCPFLPENGYGEVMVNLKWHFDRRISNQGVHNEQDA